MTDATWRLCRDVQHHVQMSNNFAAIPLARLDKDMELTLSGGGWDVIPTCDAARAYKGDYRAMRDFSAKRANIIDVIRAGCELGPSGQESVAMRGAADARQGHAGEGEADA